jgi:hypothetical protein
MSMAFWATAARLLLWLRDLTRELFHLLDGAATYADLMAAGAVKDRVEIESVKWWKRAMMRTRTKVAETENTASGGGE